MSLTAEQAAEIVAAGGKWLDVHGPVDWWDRLDLDRLDIKISDDCVLGQLFRGRSSIDETGYAWACRVLFRTKGVRGLYELGFNYPYDIRDPEDFTWGCLALTAAWRHYVAARRVAAQEPWVKGRLVDDLAVSLGQMERGEAVPMYVFDGDGPVR